MNRFARRLSITLAFVLCATLQKAQAVTIDTVTVGNPGNLADIRYDPAGFGSVGNLYQIGKYEVTASQYTEFLNAVADADPNGLYNTDMVGGFGANILRTGSSPNYNYSVAADWANRPVNCVSFWDAARFANWLHNGQPTGPQGPETTEGGAYHDVGNQALFGRNAGARFFIPTENEWYKAAYHDQAAGLTASYFDFPTGTDAVPGRDMTEATNPGNNANYDLNDYLIGSPYYRTVAGEFELSNSPYGTFDQGGNVFEWNETAVASSSQGIRGGDFGDVWFGLLASDRSFTDPTAEWELVGFRVASVPEPSTILLLGCAAGVVIVGRIVSQRTKRLHGSHAVCRLLVGTTLLAFHISAVASAAPLYNIVPLGLDDLEHTRDDGYKSSDAAFLNEAGQVTGYSDRYNGGWGRTVWLYDGASTIKIGLTGPEHTSTYGGKSSYINQYNDSMNAAGQVVGYSQRWNGGDADMGTSVWLYNGATTINIGLTDSEHTRINGFKSTSASDGASLNEAGQVIGHSLRYNGGLPELGLSAWRYNGATTIKLGYTGPAYTRNDGFKRSFATTLNDAGLVIGSSERYNGGALLGFSAWLYNGATTIELGLTGPEYTRNDGYKSSSAVELNEAGQVHGYSQRYNGGVDLGQSAWLYNGVTTVPIGLTGSEHTRNDGYKWSIPRRLNEAGQVTGYSYRYNGGSTDLGTSAWLYNGVTTIDIGLTGLEHTRNNGVKFSDTGQLNEAGLVTGSSQRYNGGSTLLGGSAWLYDGATTINIGLTGSEHTRNDGYKVSGSLQMNEAGQVSGNSSRFNGGSTNLGTSVWLYDGASTTDIGLIGVEYTRNDGYKASSASQLNETGQVRGYSDRYNGGSTYLGQDAWLYDPTLDQTFALQLSTRSDGYANSYAPYLGEDGLVLGTYTLFDALDNNLGDRAFYFTIAGGLHDLGSLVEGGLPANGWDYLADAIRANGLGQILGHGKLILQSGGQMAYLLTPVPEPSTFALAVLSALGVLIAARPKR